MEKYLIGLDFGTDSVRALAVDTSGTELASAVCEYPRWRQGLYSDAAKSQFRQHPADYLESMEKVLRSVLGNIDRAKVAGIGVDTTGSTPCPVDASGIPLALSPEFAEDPDAMFLLWKDHTAIAEAEKISAAAAKWDGPDYRTYTGGNCSCEWFWSKILHVLTVSPAVAAKAFSWVEHCDWIPAVLTGKTAPRTMRRGRCSAGHKAFWHADWGGLPPEEFLRTVDPRLAGLRKNLYAETYTAGQPAGTISAEWAAKLGLPENVVIACGQLDCHSGAVGADIRENTLVSVFGTSTCDLLVGRGTGCIPGICGQVDGSIVPGLTGYEAGQSAFGDIFAWFKKFLSCGGTVSLPELEKAAGALPLDENSVFALDWFNGRRSPVDDPGLRGAIFGLNLGSTPVMVYQALVFSACCGFRRIVEQFRQYGQQVDQVLATGGIAHKSPYIMQLCADLLDMPVQTVKSEQICALGGAMSAAAAAGLFPGLPEAMAAMASGFDRVYTPDPGRIAVCGKLYRRYVRFAALVEAASTPEEGE